MSDSKRQKLSLSDIIKKLNEEKPDSAAPSTAHDSPLNPNPDAAGNIVPQSSIERQLPAESAHGEDSTPPLPNSSPSAPSAQGPNDLQKSEGQERFAAAYPDRISGVAAFPQTDTLHAKLDVPLYSNDSEGNNETGDFDLMRYIGIVLRRKNIIIAAVLVASVFSIMSYVKAVKYFTAHTRMLFTMGGDKDIMGNTSDMNMYWDSREERLNTHLELLKSQIVLKRVAENLQNAVSPGEISGALIINCGGKEGERTDIIDVAYSHSNAETARDVANELCKCYMQYIKEVNVQDVTRLIDKLDEEIEKVDKDLSQKENTLRVFKENNRTVELSSETNMTISKLSQMELAMQQTELDMLESREKFTGLKKEIDQQQVDVIQSMTYQNPYQSKLAELELQQSSLSAEYSPEHFKVRMVRAEIDKIKNAMKSDISKEAASQTFVKNPIRESLLQSLVNVTIEKSALEAKRAAQEQLIKQLDVDLSKLPSVELQYAQLTRETESLLQVLKLLKNRFEEAKIKRDSQESDLKILEWAQTPSAAISNVKSSKILLGMFIGLVIGIALALLLEYLDQSIKEPPDVEKTLELPLLGIVPTIETEKAIIEVAKDHGKTILEPFRALRANLKHIALSRHIKTIIISSAVKGEGKTTLAANIAITFAMDGKKVILVDGDMRRAQIHGLFHIPKKDGLCDYLYGASEVRDILKPTVHQNLFVITTGEHPQNPAELLGSFRFDQLIKELRSLADFIIFDSPALLPVSDGITMAPKMDACIMVVRALWTPIKAARQAKNQLNRIGCTIIGAILNGISHSRGYYPYYYGYYRYYAYKYSYDEEPNRKFSMRKFGLRVESSLKGLLQTVRLSLPHWMASLQKFAGLLLKRKIFWLLLCISIGLVILNTMKDRGDYGISQKQSITFLGKTEKDLDKPGEITVKNDLELASFADSMELWQKAFNTKNSARYLSFYDPEHFHFPGGDFSAWEANITADLLHNQKSNSIIHIDSLWNVPIGFPYYTTRLNATRGFSQGTESVQITIMWQNINNRWRIIGQKERPITP
jgi:polysaccharide biosynthesis transport protein